MNLFPYQQEGADWLLSQRFAILADDPGLGKTAQVIRAIRSMDPWVVGPVLIVCPAALRLNWAREWEMWMGEDAPQYPSPTIASYDKVRTDKKLLEKRWFLVVFDEAHYLKNRTSKRIKVLLGRTRWDEPSMGWARQGGIRSDRAWFLTGTPITTCPADFFNLLHFCAPSVFISRSAYETEFCDGRYGDFGWEAKGATNIPGLREKIKASGILKRRLKSEVLTQLPPKRRQIVEIPKDMIGSDGKAALRAEAREIARLFGTGFESASQLETDAQLYDAIMGSRFRHSEAIGQPKLEQGATYAHDFRLLLAPAKVQAFLAWAEEEILPVPTEKTVVWAHYKQTISSIAEGLRRRGVKFVVFDGDTRPAERDAAVQAFQNDPSVQIFLGSSAAYEGITLTAAHRAVVVEASFVPGRNTQLEDRIHRIGQDKPVLIQYLAVECSYDIRILRVVVERMAVFNQLLG